MTAMPTLESGRLIVRPFVYSDLESVHQIMNEAFGEVPFQERKSWLEWGIMNYTALAQLRQPSYGDRAIVLKSTDTLVGSVGLVQSYGPFGKLPYFRERSSEPKSELCTPEMGMLWGVGNQYRGHGYATEAAQLLIDYMFTSFGLKRIVATTDYENENSRAVMRHLGMTVQRNPDPDPPWFQMVGIRKNPALKDH